jgi:tetratricopeptide (TPR) repeat protein
MLRFLLAFAFAVLLCAALPARSQPAPDAAPAAPPAAATIPERSLDGLFDQLVKDTGTPSGKLVEAEILKRFHQSGSDTVDLLLSWSVEAMEEKEYPLALDLLDQVVMLAPGFAEGWNKRATVHFMNDDFGSSLADLRQTLAIEPRHFGALSGLGMIYSAMERKEEAIRAFRKALEINPQMERVKESLERLEKEVAGESI